MKAVREKSVFKDFYNRLVEQNCSRIKDLKLDNQWYICRSSMVVWQDLRHINKHLGCCEQYSLERRKFCKQSKQVMQTAHTIPNFTHQQSNQSFEVTVEFWLMIVKYIQVVLIRDVKIGMTRIMFSLTSCPSSNTIFPSESSTAKLEANKTKL